MQQWQTWGVPALFKFYNFLLNIDIQECKVHKNIPTEIAIKYHMNRKTSSHSYVYVVAQSLQLFSFCYVDTANGKQSSVSHIYGNP